MLSKNKKQAATYIIDQVNNRIDPEYYKYLSETDKRFVIRLIEEFISGELQFKLNSGEMVVRKQKDYDEFLSEKKYILQNCINENVKE